MKIEITREGIIAVLFWKLVEINYCNISVSRLEWGYQMCFSRRPATTEHYPDLYFFHRNVHIVDNMVERQR